MLGRYDLFISDFDNFVKPQKRGAVWNTPLDLFNVHVIFDLTLKVRCLLLGSLD